jgi:hypothetical protein
VTTATASAPSLPITAEWRRAVADRLDELRMNRSDLARAVSTSTTTISMILAGKQPASSFVTAIERAVDLPAARPPTVPLALVVDPSVAATAELRAARDAINADISRLELVQRTVAERLAEAYQAHAELDVEIRRLRGGGEP